MAKKINQLAETPDTINTPVLTDIIELERPSGGGAGSYKSTLGGVKDTLDQLTLDSVGDGVIQVMVTGSGTDIESIDDLGVVSNIEEVDCAGGTGAASPNTHWTRVFGPDPGASATLSLALPAVSVFGAVDQTKVISAGVDVDGSHVVNVDLTNIKNGDGSTLTSLQLTEADQYVVLRLFDMTQWRVIKVVGATIAPVLIQESINSSRQLLNDLKATDGGGLNLNVAAGGVTTPYGTINFGGDTIALVNDSANFVGLSVSAVSAGVVAALSSSTVGFAAGVLPIAEVTVESGAITDIADRRGFLFSPVFPLNDVTTSQFDVTNSTSLTDIPGLSVPVVDGGTYIFEATLFTVSNIGTGVKAAIAGTATATSIIYEGTTYSAGIPIATAATRSTALESAVGGVTAVTEARIDITGTIVVDQGGTLTVQFAQNAAIAATDSSVLIGSKLKVTRVS